MDTRTYMLTDSHTIPPKEVLAEIRSGSIFAFPTETVYGLGADARSDRACADIYRIKRRPNDNPLIVHLAETSDIETYAIVHSSLEYQLIEACMPGPFTLILDSREMVSSVARCGLPTVGIRIPEYEPTRALLRCLAIPIAAPSANRSGRPSATDATTVLEDFSGNIPILFDGGTTRYGIESTVVRVQDGRVIILRSGMITREDIMTIVGSNVSVEYTRVSDADAPRSPGTKYRHYAPSASIDTFDILTIERLEREISLYGNIAVIATEETLAGYMPLFQDIPTVRVYPWGSRERPVEMAYRLYFLYRDIDRASIPRILIESLPEEGIGYTIMDRVHKSIHS